MGATGLRVAFDMDGTVADMRSVLDREAARLFGPGSTADPREERDPNPPPDAAIDEWPMAVGANGLELDRQQWLVLWNHVRGIDDFWLGLPETEPGIVARIAAAARARRWDVIFITTRPDTTGDTTQRQTQRWLHAHGFELPSVYVLQRSRGKLADVLELDVVVDDREANCLDIAIDSKATALMLWPDRPEALPPALQRVGVRPVASIGAAVTWLESLDDSRRRSPAMRRIRRMLRRD